SPRIASPRTTPPAPPADWRSWRATAKAGAWRWITRACSARSTRRVRRCAAVSPCPARTAATCKPITATATPAASRSCCTRRPHDQAEEAAPRRHPAQGPRPHPDDPRGHRRRHRCVPRRRRQDRSPGRHPHPAQDRCRRTRHPQQGELVAKPNYSYEKRQRELAKKKKKEEKEAKKRDARGEPGPGQERAGG